MGRRGVGTLLLVVLTACAACSGGTAEPRGLRPSGRPTASAAPSATPTAGPGSAPLPPPPVRAANFPAGTAERAVRHLAAGIGPRHATSPAFRQAVTWVQSELRALGYRVELQRFRVPGGVSWGVPVAEGTSTNVVATPPRFKPGEPHLVVGAHLDTVPQAPGAEDNASGVAVLLAAARVVARSRTRLPVVWVAFGAEEPRGPTDDDHHYGSRAYVARMTGAERRALQGMVSLDRVGVGPRVPVGSAHQDGPVQSSLLAAARRAGVEAFPAPFSRSSDHWSFVRERLPGARLGSTPYEAYHSARDRPSVVERDQLVRTGRLLLEWLAPSS